MKTIRRCDLYQKIWSITKTKTALELGVTLAYLTKICQENNIPTPTSNYWVQKSLGRSVEQTILPDADVNILIELDPQELLKRKQKKKSQNIYAEILDEELAREKKEKESKRLKREAKAGKFIINFDAPDKTWYENINTVVNAFPVPEVLKTRREIVLRTKAYFRFERLSGYEQMQHKDYGKFQTHLNIKAEPELQNRALCLFDTLINIFEALGGEMSYENDRTYVKLGDVKISIRMTAPSKRINIPENEQSYGYKFKSVPTGRIRICLGMDRFIISEAVVEDSLATKVENKLDAVVRKSLDLVKKELDRREHERLEEIEKKKNEEARRQEEERLRQIELKKKQERADVRAMFNKLRREMIVDLIERILSNKEQSGKVESMYDNDAQTIKLRALQNLFSTQRALPVDLFISEEDIDSLAEEFFTGSNKEQEKSKNSRPSWYYGY